MNRRALVACLATLAIVPTLAAVPATASQKKATTFSGRWPDRAPDASGHFEIRYNPIMCIKAPCPAGSYFVTIDGKARGGLRSIVIEDLSVDPAKTTIYTGRYVGRGATSVDGSLWFEAGSALIKADSITQGD